jgi:hypothetical protein
MKYVFLCVFTMAFATPVMADPVGQAISDGTTLVAIQKALASKIEGSNFSVTDYARAWSSYNPMSWVVDPERSYRTISLSFTDSQGKKQKMSCSLNILRGETDVTIHSCTGGDKPLGLYSKLAKYGYSAESVILDNVIIKPAGGDNNQPSTTH